MLQRFIASMFTWICGESQLDLQTEVNEIQKSISYHALMFTLLFKVICFILLCPRFLTLYLYLVQAV